MPSPGSAIRARPRAVAVAVMPTVWPPATWMEAFLWPRPEARPELARAEEDGVLRLLQRAAREIATAASSTALTTSGLGRRPSRSTGPEIDTAPRTPPEPSRTGADSE